MKKIIGIGNALVDVLVQINDDSMLTALQLPKGGMTPINDERMRELHLHMKALHPHRATGGCASNTMLALANLGVTPGFIGKIGRDETGSFFAETFKQLGIQTQLSLCDTPSGVANTFISADGERTFGTYLGAAAQMQPEEITPDMFHGYNLLYIEGYLILNHELIEKICRTAKEEGLTLCIDLGSYNLAQTLRPLFLHLLEEYIDIVFANEEECAALTEEADAKEGMRRIAQLCNLAIVKLGSKGAMAMWGASSDKYGTEAYTPTSKVKVVDTTGAGDFFSGGFLYGFCKGASLEQCLKMGDLVATNVIQVIGTRLSDKTWKKIRSSIKELY